MAGMHDYEGIVENDLPVALLPRYVITFFTGILYSLRWQPPRAL
jgi:hypothetical protein